MKAKLLISILLINYLHGFNFAIVKPISRESVKESELFTKIGAKNLDDVLENAVMKHRISSIDQYRLYALYAKWKNGGAFMAKCLAIKGCNPYKFYKEVYNKPPLYRHIYLKYPNISKTLLIQKVGQVNEKIMDKYFERAGWKKINGEVGRNGVDGLYVKYDKYGNIKDVMLVEAKYNKSMISKTVDGSKQMSKKWSIKKLDELIKKYPNNPEYKIIKNRILSNSYRARLWKMSEKDGKLIFELKKIIPQQKDIKIENLKGSEKTKINYKNNFSIDINNPKTPFQTEVLEWYQEAINQI